MSSGRTFGALVFVRAWVVIGDEYHVVRKAILVIDRIFFRNLDRKIGLIPGFVVVEEAHDDGVICKMMLEIQKSLPILKGGCKNDEHLGLI